MTIQISLILWTVICFVLFALILHNLLFKPLLALMDKRREKLEAAERIAASNAEKLKEHEKLREGRLELAGRLAKVELRELEERARDTAATTVDETINLCNKRIADAARKAELDRRAMLEALKLGASEIAVEFAVDFTDCEEG